MRCMYRKKAYLCGDYIEIDIYPVFTKAGERRKKAKPTSEVQEKLNRRNAERKLIRLLNTNFTGDDIEIHLTYSDECLPKTEEEAKKNVRNYLRRVKRARIRAGISEELKYVAITEGDGDHSRYHHHITLSGGISRDELEKAWGKGYANTRRLQFSRNGIEGLARYITKQFKGKKTGGKRSWTASGNLQKPEVREETGKITQKQVAEMATTGDVTSLNNEYNGFDVTELRCEDNLYNSGKYVMAILRRDWRKKTENAV